MAFEVQLSAVVKSSTLTFDQLVGQHIDYVKGNKSHVASNGRWATTFSNNIMMAGKHYASFEVHHERNRPTLSLGVMRPGEVMQSAEGVPLFPSFFNNFTQREGSRQYNNSVNCCMYYSFDGSCCSSDWGEGSTSAWVESNVRSGVAWDGMERIHSGSFTIGMLLDLEEGTLSVYKNERRLGVMKRGLAGQYCWVVSMVGPQVAIKRGPVPTT